MKSHPLAELFPLIEPTTKTAADAISEGDR
jgi:hypothetical protein